MASPPTPPLLGVRTTLILLAGLLFGVLIGALTAAAGQHPALAVVVGLGAGGATTMGLHKLVSP